MCDVVVARGREAFDVGTVRAQGGLEHRPVRLVDLAGLERFSWCAQLGAGRDDGDTRRACADELGNAGCGERADLRGSEPGPCLEHDVALSCVAATRSDVVILANGLANLDA